VTTYTQTFGGTNIYPSDVSYRYVSLTVDELLNWPLETAPTNNVVASIMDVDAQSQSRTIFLPPATQVGAGQTILFNNVGAYTFTIRDFVGNQVCAPQSGTTFQIYLTNNATSGGTWRSFQYGASASATNASSLAGLGIKAIATTLNQSIDVATFSTNYTAGIPDRAKAFVWTGGSGTFGLTAAPTLGADWFVQVRNNGSGDLTIDPNSSETINGQATLVLSPGDSAIVITDGLEFWTIGFGQAAEYAFSLLSIDVSGSGNYTLSANELNRTVYVFTGTLTGNRYIIVPPTVQQYWVSNQTSGSYEFGVKTATQASPGITLQTGSRAIFYCDGTDVVDADTSTISIPVQVNQGGTGATTASGARTNLGATTIGDAVFTAANTTAAQIALGLDPIEGGTY
jgi:hypothetical protein